MLSPGPSLRRVGLRPTLGLELHRIDGLQQRSGHEGLRPLGEKFSHLGLQQSIQADTFSFTGQPALGKDVWQICFSAEEVCPVVVHAFDVAELRLDAQLRCPVVQVDNKEG